MLPGDRGHEGLSKKNYRTYSKLYRDPAAFEVVEDEVLWELGKEALQRKAGERTIDAWSCGCSAGEEMFSLLMSWEQVLMEHFPGVELQFLGTDLSNDAIDAAGRAEYGAHAVQDVPEAWLERCFDVRRGEEQLETYTVLPHLKEHATFVQQDMREKMPDQSFDLVTCRYSVFLYCSRDECAAFLQQLVKFQCLRPGGFLFIGQPDELPAGWRSLGLQEWRGHQGLYRLAGAVDPIVPQPGNIRAAHGSLRDFLGDDVKRPASERIGRPEEVKEAVTLTPEQMALNLERFDKWHEAREKRAVQLRAEALDKEKAEIAPPVFISQKKVQAFAQRMQEEAARRDKKLKESQELAHGTEKKKKKKARKAAVGRRQSKSPTEEQEAALRRAAEASALWIARTRTKADRTAGTWGPPRAVTAPVVLSRKYDERAPPGPDGFHDRRRIGSAESNGSRERPGSGSGSPRESRLMTEVEAQRHKRLAAARSSAGAVTSVRTLSERERRAQDFKLRLEAQEQERILKAAAALDDSEGSGGAAPMVDALTGEQQQQEATADGVENVADAGARARAEWTRGGSPVANLSHASAQQQQTQEQQTQDQTGESVAAAAGSADGTSRPIPLSPAMGRRADVDLAPPSFSPTGSSFSPTGSFLTVLVAAPKEHELSHRGRLYRERDAALREEMASQNGAHGGASALAAAAAGSSVVVDRAVAQQLADRALLMEQSPQFPQGMMTRTADAPSAASASGASTVALTPRLPACSSTRSTTTNDASGEIQTEMLLPTEAKAEPYLRALAGSAREAPAEACVAATDTAAGSTETVRGGGRPAAQDCQLTESCVTVQASSVPCRPEPQQQQPAGGGSGRSRHQNASGTSVSAHAASLGIGFGKGCRRPASAKQQHQHQQQQQQQTLAQRRAMPSVGRGGVGGSGSTGGQQAAQQSIEAHRTGRAVATAFSAAKRYSSDAAQRCSAAAGLPAAFSGAGGGRSSSSSPLGSAGAALCSGSAGKDGRRATFEQAWVNNIAAQPRLVTSSDGRRSWRRGW